MKLERYDRQLLSKHFSEEDQQKLLLSRVAIVGAGAIGSATVELLARAGVGYIRLIDDDRVDLSNLQRQVIYTEKDIGKHKAALAKEFIENVNSDVEVEAFVVRLDHKNAGDLLASVDLVLDATDNMQSRFVINDFSIKTGTPWIFTSAGGVTASMMVIVPSKTPCLKCIFPTLPKKPTIPTGVLNQTTVGIASIRAVQAMKILTGKDFAEGLLYFDSWKPSIRVLKAKKKNDCSACGDKK